MTSVAKARSCLFGLGRIARIVAQVRRFRHSNKKLSHVGHTGTGESQPFHIKTAIKPELKRCSVSTYRICLTESLTWDDACQLWDNGALTAEDIKNIAPLYFEKAELIAVLEVIEKVENDSYTPETMNTKRGDYLRHPAAMKVCIGVSKYLEFEGVQKLLDADCDTPSATGKPYFERAWRGLH